MTTPTRERMITATIEALRHRGVAGMSFSEVLARSGAARGAIYHHFPGGKAELVETAGIRFAADVRAQLDALPSGSQREVVESFLDAVRPAIAGAAAGGGCPVAAIAVGDGAGNGDVAAAAIGGWIAVLAERLQATGLERGAAADLATALITLLEGAQILCRAAGSTEPFDAVRRVALGLVQAERPARSD
jgi:TetR/AcrR family transcriptional repressor of lmrAB and yxaGH operons